MNADLSIAQSAATPSHHDLNALGFCRTIIEHAPLPMAAVEGSMHSFRYANASFCHLIDKTIEQLAGKSFVEILPDKVTCVSLLDRVFHTGKPESYREQGSAPLLPELCSYTMWPIMAGKYPLGVMIQIAETTKFYEQAVAMNEALLLGAIRQHELTEATDSLNAQLQAEIAERRQTEKALHKAQGELADRADHLEQAVAERTTELTATNRQLEAFVYSIAHDLRAPLRAMQGFSEMLEEEVASLSEIGRNFAHRINTSAQFMDALLTDLLTFSALSQQRVQLTPVNLGKTVEFVLSHLQVEVNKKKAHIVTVGPWPNVLGHESTLSQVLVNLITNALKFTSPEVQPRVCVRVEDQSEYIRVWVEDNGIGIAPDHQDQIFRLFNRLHGEKYPGTGIGLAIVEKGIERMGGRVGLESTPGQGSRFWFVLKKAPVI